MNGNWVIVKPNAFIDISQMWLICNKNLTTEPAEEGNCVCGSALGKLNTLGHFPFRSVSTSEFYRTKIKRSHARQTSASPGTVPFDCHYNKVQGRARLFSVFSRFVWQPRFHKLASWMPTRAVLRTPPLQMKYLSPVLTVSPSNWRGTTGGLRKLLRWLRSSF